MRIVPTRKPSRSASLVRREAWGLLWNQRVCHSKASCLFSKVHIHQKVVRIKNLSNWMMLLMNKLQSKSFFICKIKAVASVSNCCSFSFCWTIFKLQFVATHHFLIWIDLILTLNCLTNFMILWHCIATTRDELETYEIKLEKTLKFLGGPAQLPWAYKWGF